MKHEIIPWLKYGLIVELAVQLEKSHMHLGKTALQKVIYLLQELYDTDCGYEFEFYTYGPFSSQIMADLDTVNQWNGVSVTSLERSSGYHGFEIKPGKAGKDLLEKAKSFLEEHRGNISKMVNDFGSCKAEELELYSTIVWVDHDLKSTSKKRDKNSISDIVKELKPKFDKGTIHNAFDFMLGKGFILT